MMKINILSPGRFHVLDLARELAAQGFDVKFYSYVPTKRAEKYGLKRENSKSLFGIMLPFLGMQKMFSKNLYFKRLTVLFQDFISGIYMRKADVVIAMSGNYVYSLRVAKKRKMQIILERGSKHILEQRKILEAIPSLQGKMPVPDFNVKRELIGYNLADIISIASQHVKTSFLINQFPEDKLFLNPYGVDLTSFNSDNSITKEYDIIMVGGWSYRKGCDLIITAVKNLNLKFLHVGSIVDLDFPANSLFTHIDSVDQSELSNYYNKAKISILPSREEGLAMVQMQAISCNLPLVCSKHSGGEDLKNYFTSESAIFVMDDLTSGSLQEKIVLALKFYNNVSRADFYDIDVKKNLTWEAYGERYSRFLNKFFA